MKISDCIVKFLIKKKITDIFGYPGGMVTHFMDSLHKYSDEITAHIMGNEQGAALSACGYAEVTHRPGVAYATSGPGVTNLMTGIANSYFDSLPCIFITGQVNVYEQKGGLPLRQRGFQEMDVVEVVRPITKYAVKIIDAESMRYELEKAFFIATSGRPGPVVLDIPMNVFSSNVDWETLNSYVGKNIENSSDKHIKEVISTITHCLRNAKKPVIIAGHGIALANCVKEFRKFIKLYQIPTVTSMIGRDVLLSECSCNYGFLGAYGHRAANIIVNKSDLIISIGSRLDCRQVGNNLQLFAPDAKLIRLEVDENEWSRKIKENEIDYIVYLPALLNELYKIGKNYDFFAWRNVCNIVSTRLKEKDSMYPNRVIQKFSDNISTNSIITADVGQNQVWIAQSFKIKEDQRILFSGGHGAMGYSLPAAIGAAIATKKKVVCFNGDGGFQMNMQELEVIRREKLPIKIIILNNHALGMIRHFQEMYFKSCFAQTVQEGGYTTPNFKKIAAAYDLPYICIKREKDFEKLQEVMQTQLPYFIEVLLNEKTYVYPKLAVGMPISNQEPLLENDEYENLMRLCDEF